MTKMVGFTTLAQRNARPIPIKILGWSLINLLPIVQNMILMYEDLVGAMALLIRPKDCHAIFELNILIAISFVYGVSI